ncbi:MAG: dephospho-CoA kinase [Chloroflexi bacterium]|nr:dephospho-CoA kinase [Chloroflexota bacterium]
MSGKSTVSAMLKELGACAIDADKIGHECYKPHAQGWGKMIDLFGKDILGIDDEIDRAKLSQIVFENADALQKLNDTMHPIIRSSVEEKIKRFEEQGAKVVVVEAPVFLEAGWSDMVDQLWVTSVPEDVAAKRFSERSGLSAQEADRRIKSQMSNKERIKHADRVIDTNSSIEATKADVEKAWRELNDTSQGINR